MPKPSETLWGIEPHTKAKHEILRRYLGAWFAILGSTNSRIVYIDGFCGPGKYLGGEDGSPIIALNEAINHQARLANSNISFLFIDERDDRIAHLKSELAQMNIPGNYLVNPLVNQFENTLTGILDSLAQGGHLLAPTFAFIDPFGFKGASFSVVQRLLSNPKTEIFINIMAEFINRFADHPSPDIRDHIKNLLGASDAEIDQVLNSSDRMLAFRQLYQDKLHQHAKFVRYFEMRDRNDKIIYYLFFAGNHPLGHVKMKEAFWKVDGQSGFAFSDGTDPNQLVMLNVFDPSPNLAALLKTHYTGTTQLSEKIISYVENETAYLATHARKALIYLEARNEISIYPNKSDGKKRIKGTFPDGVIITF